MDSFTVIPQEEEREKRIRRGISSLCVGHLNIHHRSSFAFHLNMDCTKLIPLLLIFISFHVLIAEGDDYKPSTGKHAAFAEFKVQDFLPQNNLFGLHEWNRTPNRDIACDVGFPCRVTCPIPNATNIILWYKMTGYEAGTGLFVYRQVIPPNDIQIESNRTDEGSHTSTMIIPDFSPDKTTHYKCEAVSTTKPRVFAFNLVPAPGNRCGWKKYKHPVPETGAGIDTNTNINTNTNTHTYTNPRNYNEVTGSRFVVTRYDTYHQSPEDDQGWETHICHCKFWNVRAQTKAPAEGANWTTVWTDPHPQREDLVMRTTMNQVWFSVSPNVTDDGTRYRCVSLGYHGEVEMASEDKQLLPQKEDEEGNPEKNKPEVEVAEESAPESAPESEES